MGTDGNEIADQLDRQDSPPTHALGMSTKVARGLIRGWTCRKHNKHWPSIRGLRQAMGLLKKSSAKSSVLLM